MTETTAPVEPKKLGEELLLAIFEKAPKDSYQPNGLPPIDDGLHTEEAINKLQRPALGLE